MSRLCGQSGFLPARWSVAQKPLQLSHRSLLLQGREDDQLHVRGIANAEARIFEQHPPGSRVFDPLLARQRARHLALPATSAQTPGSAVSGGRRGVRNPGRRRSARSRRETWRARSAPPLPNRQAGDGGPDRRTPSAAYCARRPRAVGKGRRPHRRPYSRPVCPSAGQARERAAQSGCPASGGAAHRPAPGPQAAAPAPAGHTERRDDAFRLDRAARRRKGPKAARSMAARPALARAKCTKWSPRRRGSPLPRGAGRAFVAESPRTDRRRPGSGARGASGETRRPHVGGRQGQGS